MQHSNSLLLLTALFLLPSLGACSNPTLSVDVSVSWSSYFVKKDRDSTLAKMNEIASSKAKDLGFQFNFKPVEKDADLDLGITVPMLENLPFDYLGLPTNTINAIDNTPYLPCVNQFVEKGLTRNKFIPLSITVSGFVYKQTDYPNGFASFQNLVDQVSDKDGLIGVGNDFLLSLFIGNKTIDLADCDKLDGEGKPIWANKALEDYYASINETLCSNGLVRDSSIVDYNFILENHGVLSAYMASKDYCGEDMVFSLFPKIDLGGGKSINPGTLGVLYGASFPSKTSLSEKQREAVSTLLMSLEGEDPSFNPSFLPILDSSYSKDAFKSMAEDMRTKPNVSALHAGVGFLAASDFMVTLIDEHKEGFSFTDRFEELYERRSNSGE